MSSCRTNTSLKEYYTYNSIVLKDSCVNNCPIGFIKTANNQCLKDLCEVDSPSANCKNEVPCLNNSFYFDGTNKKCLQCISCTPYEHLNACLNHKLKATGAFHAIKEIFFCKKQDWLVLVSLLKTRTINTIVILKYVTDLMIITYITTTKKDSAGATVQLTICLI